LQHKLAIRQQQAEAKAKSIEGTVKVAVEAA